MARARRSVTPEATSKFFREVCNFEQRADICLPYLLGVLNPTCPSCRSPEPTVTHESVGTGFYYCRACEHAWYEERRSLALLVPSLAAPGLEWNVLINQQHSDFAKVAASKPRPIVCHPKLIV